MALLKSLLLALGLTLCLFAIADGSDTKWAVADSQPSLYWAFSAYCNPWYLTNWTCGFCKHNPNTKVVGLLEDFWSATFGYVAISGNEGTTNVHDQVALFSFASSFPCALAFRTRNILIR